MTDIKYKYATWILAVVVIVLVVWLAVKPAPSASDQFTEAQANLTNCVDRLKEWRSGLATSTDAKERLEEILAGCQNNLKDASQAI